MPAIEALEKQLDQRPELCGTSPDMMFYRICDSLVDSVFPLLDHIGAQIDAVEDEVLENPDRETLRTIFGLKRDLLTLRRVTGPQRDLLQSLTSPRTPRIGDETQLFLRDVYDHTVRIAEEVELVPRPGERLARRLPDVHLQPARRADAAADRGGHHLPAADLSHRVLRHELRLPRRSTSTPPWPSSSASR